MFNLAGIFLAAAALVTLLIALPPARRLLGELPAGRMRSQCLLLAGLVALSMLGYALYLVLFWDRHQSWASLLAPLLFFGSAIFALLSVRMSLATVINVRRMPALERADITDALTGLKSRQYFDTRMHEELLRAERHGLAVSVMLLDVDNFASVNEAYGQAVGD